MGYQFNMKMIGKKDLKPTTFEGKEIYNNHFYEVVTIHSNQLVHNHQLCMNLQLVIIKEVSNLFEGMDVIHMKNNCNSIVHKILINKRHCWFHIIFNYFISLGDNRVRGKGGLKGFWEYQ